MPQRFYFDGTQALDLGKVYFELNGQSIPLGNLEIAKKTEPRHSTAYSLLLRVDPDILEGTFKYNMFEPQPKAGEEFSIDENNRVIDLGEIPHCLDCRINDGRCKENMESLYSFFEIEFICSSHLLRKSDLELPTTFSPLTLDMEKAFRDDDKDFTVISHDNDGGQIQFKCHSFAMALRSDVLKAMLGSDLREKATKEIIIQDFSPQVVGQMIEFIYTDSVQEISKNPTELFTIGDKYNIQGLKQLAAREMVKSLTIENAIANLILLHNNETKDSYKIAKNYFKTNFAKIKETTEFKTFIESGENPEIIMDILSMNL